MILRRLRVNPFGRFADREVSFGPGLTVVLGANEVGKSTLWYAIRSVLLRPARLDARQFRSVMARFLPIEGGDVAVVEIGFSARDGDYVLSRRWGARAGSQIRMPGGGPLTDEASVQEEMARLLPASPATVGAVLMVRQSELGATIKVLEDDTAAKDDVSALLRRMVQETGGVSVDAVRRTLAERIAKLYGRWDRSRGGPEKGRGIENPWDRGVGEVLAAWYAAERARATWEQACAFERDLDELNGKIEEAGRERDGRERFLQQHAAAFRDAGERGALEAGLAAEREKKVRLSRDTDEWPVAEARARQLDVDIAATERRLPALAADAKAAGAAQERAVLREKAARAERRAARLAAAEAALAAAPAIDRSLLGEIQAADRDVLRLRAAGGPLSLRLAARAGVRLELRREDGPAQAVELAAGETRAIDAGSAFSLGLRDLDIAVAPAVAPGADLAGAVNRLSQMLARSSLADLAAAETACRAREDAAAERDRARRDLEDELGGEPLESLRSRVEALGEEHPARPLTEATRDLAAAEASLVTSRGERKTVGERLAELEQRYGTRERLHEDIGECARRTAELERRIASCAPLPAGFADAAAFVAAYEAERTRRDAAKERVSALLLDRARREGEAPEETAEELDGRRRDAGERYAATMSRAKAVERVAAAVEAVAGSDDAIYRGLADDVERRFAALSLGAHPALVMKDRLPAAVKTATGVDLPWEWLSAGARDLLGLAVRLAMAGIVIADQGGFLLMDDPLVDLDPERQAAAAGAIREFSSRRQTIVFTCHPAHAELLGGEVVRLD